MNIAQPRRRTKIIATILTVLIPAFVVTGAVFAVTTIGTGITTTGDLTAKTGGAATFVVAASDASARVKNQADYVADGTGDDVEIQAAIDALPTAGGKITLSEGTFTTAAEININDNDIALVGSGTGTIVKAGNSTNFSNGVIKTSGGKSRILIANLTVDGNKANNSGGASGIQLTSASTQITIENVRILNSDGKGIMVQAARNVLISGCYVDSPATKGINITGDQVSHVRVEGCHIVSTVEAGIEIDDGANDVTVVGNIFEDSSTTATSAAIGVHNHAGLAGPMRIVIANNVIEGGTSNGIVVKDQGGTSVPREITISGNAIEAPTSAQAGILVRGSQFVTVQGNSTEAGSRGIQIDDHSTSYTTVSGNVIRNADLAGIELDNVGFVTVTDNVSVDDGAGVQNNGVLEDNGSDNNLY